MVIWAGLNIVYPDKGVQKMDEYSLNKNSEGLL